MAHARKKTSNTVGTSGNTNSWGGWFVKCTIPEEHFAQLDRLEVDFNRLADWEAEIIKSGRKLSVSFKKETNSFIASLTDQLEDSPTFRGTLSSFGSTYWGAKIALWWKHEEILAGQWKNDTERDTRYG